MLQKCERVVIGPSCRIKLFFAQRWLVARPTSLFSSRSVKITYYGRVMYIGWLEYLLENFFIFAAEYPLRVLHQYTCYMNYLLLKAARNTLYVINFIFPLHYFALHTSCIPYWSLGYILSIINFIILLYIIKWAAFRFARIKDKFSIMI